jgi:hypothetical protein
VGLVLVGVTLAAVACAPRADRQALLMERARGLSEAFEEAWVVGLKAYGKVLYEGRGGCITCHRIGDEGTRFSGPNLGVDPLCLSDAKTLTERDPVACVPVGERAKLRRPELSPIEYVVESIMDPDRVTTPTYAPKVMKRLDEPPVSLSDAEILALAAFVTDQSCPRGVLAIGDALRFMTPCREGRDAAVRP